MKHDPHVPGCAAAIEEAFRAVGAPEGVFQTLHAATEDVERVIRDPRIQAVSFTGSDRAGSLVASIAASEIKPAVRSEERRVGKACRAGWGREGEKRKEDQRRW